MQKQKKVSRVWLDRRLTATEPTKNENNAMEIASAFAILFFPQRHYRTASGVCERNLSSILNH